MAKVRSYCPVCGGDVAKADAVEVWKTHVFETRRAAAAEDVAEALWKATAAIRDLLRRREDRRADAEDYQLTSWEESALQEALAEFHEAQEVFKIAREKARV